jgi:superfamily I DNA/RNA helicase
VTSLNPQQAAAVAADSHAVVIACPGSGKTRVLVEKAARILSSDPSARVIVVTFTREAAGEIRRRLAERTPRAGPRLDVQTFHALAIRHLLASGAVRELVGPGVQTALLRRAWSHAGEPGNWEDFVRAVDARARGQSMAHAPTIEPAFDQYLALLEQHAAVDLSGSILHTVERLRAGELAPLPVTHLLVDEYQDADRAQVEWVLAHTERGSVLTAVGDDDQAIYGFRGSLGLEALSATATALGAARLSLEINYRSRSEIVGLGARLVLATPRRLPKGLQSARGPGARVVLEPCANADVECERLVSAMRAAPSEWAVIARSNAVLDGIQEALAAVGIPHARPGRSDFWQAEATSLLLALLDTTPTSLAEGTALALAGVSEGDIATLGAGRVAPRAAAAIRASLRDARQHVPGARPDLAIERVAQWLLAHYPSTSPSARAVRVAADALKRLSGSLPSRLAVVRTPARLSPTPGVQLLTMHGAKGREFRRVWLPVLVEGVVPHHKSTDLDEERRLLYVAMTRAEDELVLSFAWRRRLTESGRAPAKLTPSRFLTVDLGISLVRPADPIPPTLSTVNAR